MGWTWGNLPAATPLTTAISRKAMANPFLASLRNPLDTEPTKNPTEIKKAFLLKNAFFSSAVL